MKISKLFHWLYATLMFLPILMFIPSCLYYSLNKYATNETTTQINYKYQSNEVNTLDDLVEGNIYFCESFYFVTSDLSSEKLDIKIISTGNVNLNNYNYSIDEAYIGDNYFNNNYNFINITYDSSDVIIYFTNENAYVDIYFNGEIEFTNCIFYCDNSTLNNFKSYLLSSGSSLPQYTDYNVIESVNTNVQDTISNKMYLAWESIWNLPLFAWTKNSFVSAPFTYITGLFGVSATNSLNYVFTYFVSISICWLVFDLIMYVPNLAHKWIDKGAIE